MYIHIPWCVRKCPYCDFNSHKAEEELPEDQYCENLIEDLKQSLEWVQDRPLQSIFIGGGTPSLFSPKAFEKILGGVEAHIPFSDNIEITMEANPGTAEQQRFKGYREAGINRLSIGVQSFGNEQLQALGRIHSAEQAEKAMGMARQAGFDNVNLDLMHGLPKQSVAAAKVDLQRAIALEPEHLSWYQLTIEPNTEYFKRPPQLPIDDDLAEIQIQGQHYLAEHGFAQYEVSAYSRGKQSRHNLNYWRFGDYLGLGAGAHSKISKDEQIHRFWKTRLPAHYQDKSKQYTAGSEVIEGEQLALEFMMNALRLTDAFDLSLFETRTYLQLSTIEDKLKQLEAQGLITRSNGQLQTTELGQRFLNNTIAAFMPD
ncbi:radical SAM family heme chaperone HemW [Pseudoteredinibacter isoporae]|nr:radical SAM family heme chaperone HemW [Pseudoteredinibacter isoporae]NHO85485.1 radical SAM family heme chaperone HemW [Pseudoteredinibacter isoporae]NIB26063.1 radical SAM family heme chaperone HemW [Pseudoteredinibacter isoporae]